MIALYVLSGLTVYGFQRKLLYQPSHHDLAGVGNQVLAPWRDSRGRFLAYVNEPPGPRHVVLFFHGTGGEAISRVWFRKVAPASAVIVIAEYAGYGPRSREATTEKAVLADALELTDAVRERWKLPLVVVGESLGTAVASYVASKRPIARLGLASPFLSAADVGSYRYPYFPVRWMMWDVFPSLEFLRGVKVPLHIIHGGDDWTIPISQARALYDAYEGPKTFTEVPGIQHNVALALLGFPEAEPFLRFLEGK